MPTTDARTRANRKNAAKSTGPKTVEGKEISRRNSLKHGLSGQGIVFLDQETAEVERRTAALLKQLKPTQELSQGMIERLAVLSIRIKRCAEHETLSMIAKGDHAAREFDDNRLTEVEALYDSLAETPSLSHRKLLRSSDGIHRLIEGWTDLGNDLANGSWRFAHLHRASNLQGFRPDDCHVLNLVDFTEAIVGNFQPAQASESLRRVIEGQIDSLTDLLANFNDDEADRQRDVAIALARYAPTAETLLTRKYEAAAERNLHKVLREARFIESAPTLREQAGLDASAEPVATVDPVKTSATMASFVPEPRLKQEEADDAPLTDEEEAELSEYLTRHNLTELDALHHMAKTGEVATIFRRNE